LQESKLKKGWPKVLVSGLNQRISNQNLKNCI
jgi:hypothetical protein